MLIRRSRPKSIKDVLHCIKRNLFHNSKKDPLNEIRENRELKLRQVKLALMDAWCKETCYPSMQEMWSKDLPERGQGAVTAMVIQDYMGGQILGCTHTHHYWNQLPDGREIDITRSQFPGDLNICSDGVTERQKFMEIGPAMTKDRYIILKQRVDDIFGESKPSNAPASISIKNMKKTTLMLAAVVGLSFSSPLLEKAYSRVHPSLIPKHHHLQSSQAQQNVAQAQPLRKGNDGKSAEEPNGDFHERMRKGLIMGWFMGAAFLTIMNIRESRKEAIPKERKGRPTVRDLVLAIEKSWCKETCYPMAQKAWSPDDPSLGQCAPTAMIVQDYLKGEILYCRHQRHYWNLLPEGVEMDMTGLRFADDPVVCHDATVHRSMFTNNRDAGTLVRYVLLKCRVEKNLGI